MFNHRRAFLRSSLRCLPALALGAAFRRRAFGRSEDAHGSALEELYAWKPADDSGAASVVAISPRGDAVFSAGPDHAIRVWALGKKPTKPKSELKLEDGVNRAVLDAKGTTLVLGTQNKGVQIWPVGGKSRFVRCEDEQKRAVDVRAVAISADGLRIAAVAYSKYAFLIDAKAGKVIKRVAMQRGYIESVKNVTFAPSGHTFVIYSGGGLTVLDAKTGDLVASAAVPDEPERAIEFTAGIARGDGTPIVASLGSALFLYGEQSWPKPAKVITGVGKPGALAHSAQGNLIALALGGLKIISYQDGGTQVSEENVVAEYRPKPGMEGYDFSTVEIDPTGKLLVAGAESGELVVFKLPSPRA